MTSATPAPTSLSKRVVEEFELGLVTMTDIDKYTSSELDVSFPSASEKRVGAKRAFGKRERSVSHAFPCNLSDLLGASSEPNYERRAFAKQFSDTTLLALGVRLISSIV